MRMATCDKHLVSATSCGCDASSTAALHVARLHLHFAAQLALAQLQVSRPRLLAGCKPRRSALPAGLNQLAVLPSSSQVGAVA